MKIRLVEEYDPVTNESNYWIHELKHRFPTKVWWPVSCSKHEDVIRARWERCKTHGTRPTTTVLEEFP